MRSHANLTSKWEKFSMIYKQSSLSLLANIKYFIVIDIGKGPRTVLEMYNIQVNIFLFIVQKES